MIDDAAFRSLLDEADPAVSLFFPIGQSQRDQRGPEAALRALLERAATALAARGFDAERAERLLRPVRELMGGTDFAHHRDEGFAAFLAEGRSTILPLPVPLHEAVVVGRRFHVKPLLPLLARNRRFHVLALSGGEARLFSATPFSWQELPLDVLPADAEAEAIAVEDARGGAAPHAAGEPDPLRHELLVAEPHRVAFGVRKALGTDTAPLILAADPQVSGHFRPLAHLPQLQEEGLLLNPFAFPHAELHARALELMGPALDADLDAVLEQVQARLGTAEPTVGIRPEEILAAAHASRVDAVVVALDQALWGRFDPEDGTLVVHGHQDGAEDDLLNEAAVAALRNGGRAYAAPLDRLPRRSPAVATYRF